MQKTENECRRTYRLAEYCQHQRLSAADAERVGKRLRKRVEIHDFAYAVYHKQYAEQNSERQYEQ